MLKSPIPIRPDHARAPTRLIIFWAHNPGNITRQLYRMSAYYNINLAMPQKDKVSHTPASAENPIAEWKFKISHLTSKENANLSPNSFSASAAASASPPAATKIVEKITMVYALEIPKNKDPNNIDYPLVDSYLNNIIKRTFELISHSAQHYNLNEIILVNDANLLLSGYDVNMLPEIQDRLRSTIKLCTNLQLKEKLTAGVNRPTFVDFSDFKTDIATHIKYLKTLHEAQKIPFILGIQEAAGGQMLAVDKFNSYFNHAVPMAWDQIQSFNNLSMVLLGDKTLFNPDKFKATGTDFSNITVSIPKLDEAASASSPSTSGLSGAASSSSATDMQQPTSRPATPKYRTRSITPKNKSQADFLSEPFEWPSPPAVNLTLTSATRGYSPLDPARFSVSNSPFAKESPLPAAPRLESGTFRNVDAVHDLLIARNLNTHSLRQSSEVRSSRSNSSSSLTAATDISPEEVSPMSIVRTIPTALPEQPLLFSPEVEPLATFTRNRPEPLTLPLSGSMPCSPNTEPVTPVQIEKANSYPSTVERKANKKPCPSQQEIDSVVSPLEPEGPLVRSVSLGEGELVFPSSSSFFTRRTVAHRLTCKIPDANSPCRDNL